MQPDRNIMNITILGGLDRNAPHLERFAKARGHRIQHHNGRMTGPSSSGLKAAVSRADLLVIVTDVNSHAAVTVAKDHARRRAIPMVMVRRLTEASLNDLLPHSLRQAA